MFREKPLLPRSLVTFGVKTIFEYIAEFARYDETSLDYVQKFSHYNVMCKLVLLN